MKRRKMVARVTGRREEKRVGEGAEAGLVE